MPTWLISLNWQHDNPAPPPPPTPTPELFVMVTLKRCHKRTNVEILRADLHLKRTIKSNCGDGTLILDQKSNKRLKTGRLDDRQPKLRQDSFFSGGVLQRILLTSAKKEVDWNMALLILNAPLWKYIAGHKVFNGLSPLHVRGSVALAGLAGRRPEAVCPSQK